MFNKKEKGCEYKSKEVERNFVFLHFNWIVHDSKTFENFGCSKGVETITIKCSKYPY